MASDSAPPVLDAYAIWLKARSAVTSAQYPRRIDYTIAVNGLDGSMRSVDHYRASCDPADEAIRIFPISDEQLAQPAPVPHGVDVSVSVALSTGRLAPAVLSVPVGRPAPSADLLGEPLLSPTYMFGLRYTFANRGGTQGQSGLRVIAVVSAQAPDYGVALIDVPTIGDAPTYHLRMTPLRHPKDNRLRELWIGADDFLPRRAVVAGNFTSAPLVDVPWTVDFSIVDGVPYVVRESADATLYLTHRRVVRDAVIAFQNIRESSGSLYDEPLVEPLAGAMLEEP
jgi:hypothetical protein